MLTRLAIKLAAPLPGIENCNSFLFIGPHPDDIEIGAGATAAKLAAAGKRVCFLICTDGRYGTANAPEGLEGDALAAVRKREAAASAKVLGIDDVRFLDFSDGGFYDIRDLEAAIAREVAEFGPDVIFCPDPDVSSELHIDHLNAGNAAKTVMSFAGNPGIMKQYGAFPVKITAIAFYMTAKPDRYVSTSGFFSKQLESVFSCHVSQFPEGCSEEKSMKLYLKLRSVEYGIKTAHKTAEGFRVLGQTHIHCLPEAGK